MSIYWAGLITTVANNVSKNYVLTGTKLGLEIIDRAWAGNLYVWSAHLNVQIAPGADPDRALNLFSDKKFTAKTGDKDPAGCLREIRELKNHDDDLVDDDRKWVTLYCASATSKFRRRGVVDDAKQSRITSSCNPQASAGINPLF